MRSLHGLSTSLVGIGDVQEAGKVQAALEWQGRQFVRWDRACSADLGARYSESQKSEKGFGREHDDWASGDAVAGGMNLGER